MKGKGSIKLQDCLHGIVLLSLLSSLFFSGDLPSASARQAAEMPPRAEKGTESALSRPALSLKVARESLAPLSAVPHCGTIGSQTWSGGGTVHTINSACGTNGVVVTAGATLSIEAGAIIKFDLNTRLTVNGKLVLSGTGPARVILTSYQDDEYGGDTNMNGPSICHPDEWDGIFFTPGSDDSSIIDHALVRCSGIGYYGPGGVNFEDASPTVQNSELRQNTYCAMVADLHSFPALSGNTYTENERNALCIRPQPNTEVIDGPISWSQTDTSYFVLDSLNIVSVGTLTIDPGVVIKFNLNKRLTVNGKLVVSGTGVARVVLTSYRDDENGNGANKDSNGDGYSICNPDEWDGIFFTPGSDDSSIIDHALVRCSGIGYYGPGGVNFEDASPTVQNSELRQNTYCAMVADLHSFPALSGNTYTENERNALCIRPQPNTETINGASTWSQTDTSYYVLSSVTVDQAVGTLTLAPGVVVKFNLNQRLTINGRLMVSGTGAARVILTSYQDDAYGNGANKDSNGNGPSTCSPDEWDGILFTPTSDNSSVIDYALVRCGGIGYYGPGAISFDGVSPTVSNSVITRAAYAGIFTNNSSPVLIHNCIAFNPDFGLYNATPGTTVGARSQWWGDASGPYHPVKNPNGKGNKVSDGVDFQPWSTYCEKKVSYSSGPQDGWTLESAETSNVGGVLNAAATALIAGDNAQDKQYRSILSFNTAALPDNAVITAVTIRLKGAGFVGSNPFTTHGSLILDVRKGCFSGSCLLQVQDFQSAASKLAVTTIPNNPVNGWYSRVLPAAVYSYINKAGVTQFRLRFFKDDNDDLGADYINFQSGNSLIVGDRPQLIIQYYVP